MRVISFKNELEFFSIDFNNSFQVIVLWIEIIREYIYVYRDDDSSLKKYQLKEIYDE